jgi:hypothetical protein
MEELYYNIPIFFEGISGKGKKFRQKMVKTEVAFGIKPGFGYIIIGGSKYSFSGPI